MDYEETIEYLYDLKIYGMSLGLSRIEHLLNVLGSPHENIKAIHIAGTNGKGSVAAMISSILQAAGYKVGMFTSPHLLAFEERIAINGAKIPRNNMTSLVDRIKPIAENMAKSGEFEHPTFFETATAMAFLHFQKENVDYAVLEVGLGGRLDATNVVTPLVSVITSLALDHTHVLGESLEEVAKEKAGIIKHGVPVVTGVEDDEILDILKAICQEKNCKIFVSKEHGAYTSKEANLDIQTFDLKGMGTEYKDLKIHLLGKHQLKNAHITALTLEVLRENKVSIPESSIKHGFENSRWPARLEVVQKNPTIILDCAHNPAGMNALRRALDDLFNGKKPIIIMGIMRDKDITGIVKEIAPRADHIIITKPEFERAAEPESIESEVKKYCDDVRIISKVSDAVKYAIDDAEKSDVICITGSIFNVSEAMEALIKKNMMKPP
jgi:dihydrofolate synthase/folylpolyglutamate synthase